MTEKLPSNLPAQAEPQLTTFNLGESRVSGVTEGTAQFKPSFLKSEYALHHGVRASMTATAESRMSFHARSSSKLPLGPDADTKYKKATVYIITSGPDRRYNNDVREISATEACNTLAILLHGIAQMKAMSEANLQFKTEAQIEYSSNLLGRTPMHLTLVGYEDKVQLRLDLTRVERVVTAYTRANGIHSEFIDLLKSWEKMILQLKSMYETIEGEEENNPFAGFSEIQQLMRQVIPEALLSTPTREEQAQARLQKLMNPQPTQFAQPAEQQDSVWIWVWAFLMTIYDLMSGSKRR